MLALKVHPRILPFMQMELNVTPFNFWNFDNQQSDPHYLMAYVITVILNFVICCFCNAVLLEAGQSGK
jgi:hypothetical protein